MTGAGESPFATLAGRETARSRVVRLTPTEVWTAPFEVPLRMGEPVQLHLSWSDREIGPVRATIGTLPRAFADNPWIALGVEETDERLGGQLVDLIQTLCERGLAEPPADDPESEIIVDPAVMASLSKSLLRPGREANLVGQSHPSRVVLQSIDGADRWAWSHVAVAPTSSGQCMFEIEGYFSVYRVSCDLIAEDNESLITTAARKIVRMRRRNYRRAAPAQRLSVSFRHPLWHGVTIEARQVKDLSFEGLSFVTQARKDLLFPGLVIPSLRVTRPDGSHIWLSAQVSSVRQVGALEVCGLRVNPLEEEDGTRWMKTVNHGLHPSTDDRTDWAGPAWELFRRSGYFSLSGKSPDEFEDLREHLVNVTESLASSPRLSCQTVFRSERGVEATVWSLRAYSGTWLGHQLAKRPSCRSPGVLRDIYLRIFEAAQHAAHSHWLLCYLESHVRWNQDVHIAFTARHADRQRACAIPFNLVEVQCQSAEHLRPYLDQVGPATKEEMVLLWETIADNYPRAYIEALDLLPARWHLQDITAEWNLVGLDRSRTFCVARRDGRAIAAGIIETGESGTNLFRLLDGVRLYELEPGGCDAFDSLLGWAREYYAQRGKKSFMYFMEERRPELIERAELRDLGAGFIWIISIDLLPNFLEHVCQYTSEREASLPASRSSRPAALASAQAVPESDRDIHMTARAPRAR